MNPHTVARATIAIVLTLALALMVWDAQVIHSARAVSTDGAEAAQVEAAPAAAEAKAEKAEKAAPVVEPVAEEIVEKAAVEAPAVVEAVPAPAAVEPVEAAPAAPVEEEPAAAAEAAEVAPVPTADEDDASSLSAASDDPADDRVYYNITWQVYDVYGNIDEDQTFPEQWDSENPIQYWYDNPTRAPYTVNGITYTYEFLGWDPDISSGDVFAYEGMKLTAQFQDYAQAAAPTTYTITWVDSDGRTLAVNEVEPGVTPVYNNGKDPAKIADESIYTFTGWEPEVVPADGNATYTATYSTEPNLFTVTWLGAKGKTLEVDEDVLWGTKASYDGATPEMESTPEYSYEFTGWNDPYENDMLVGADTEYTAQFKAVPNQYTVTYQIDGDVPAEAAEMLAYPAYNGEAGSKTYNYGAKVSLANDMDLAGYKFSGWTVEGADANGGTFDMPANNVVVKGSFTAADVPYRVEHYTQNVDPESDGSYGYTLERAFDKTAKAGAEVTVEPYKVLEGFIIPSEAQTVTIAGDGSTVVKFYYDRVSNPVIYQYSGLVPENAPAVPQTVEYRYGELVHVAPIPQLAGYTFNGWNMDDFRMEPSRVILAGSWEAMNMGYTVEYWYENDRGEFIKRAEDSFAAPTGATVKADTTVPEVLPAGATGTYELDTQHTVSEGVVTQIGLTLKVYFRHHYTVTYQSGDRGTFTNGETSFEFNDLRYGDTTPAAPALNVTEGYHFTGWNPTYSDTVVQSVDYLATYAADTDTDYTIEFYYQRNGAYANTASDSITLGGTTDTDVGTEGYRTPSRAGYAYDADSNLNVAEGTISGDGKLVLKVYFKQQFSVSFQAGAHGSFANGGKSVGYTLSYDDETPAAPQVVADDGWAFDGWNADIADQVTGSVVYQATWKADYSGTAIDGSLADGITYNGTAHALAVNGLQPGDVVTFKNSDTVLGVKQVADGETSVAQNFTHVADSGDITVEVSRGTGTEPWTGTAKVAIEPATLTVLTPSASKAYDGTALTSTGSISGLQGADEVTFATTGTQTVVGESENGYTLQFDRSARAADYTVEATTGTLTVTAPAGNVYGGTDDNPQKIVNVSHNGTGFNVGDEVTFTVTITNIYGDAQDITVADGNADALYVGNQTVSDGSYTFANVAPGQTVTLVAVHTVTADDLVNGYLNDVSATFSGVGATYNDSNSVSLAAPAPANEGDESGSGNGNAANGNGDNAANGNGNGNAANGNGGNAANGSDGSNNGAAAGSNDGNNGSNNGRNNNGNGNGNGNAAADDGQDAAAGTGLPAPIQAIGEALGLISPEAIDDSANPLAEAVDDEGNPLYVGDGTGAATGTWSLVDLLAMIGTVLLAAALIAGRREDDAADEHRRLRLASLVPAAAAVVALLLTQDFAQPMALFDQWTILFAIILAVQGAMTFVLRREAGSDDTPQQGGYAPASA